MDRLTAFQRAPRYVIAGSDEPHGLALKRELEGDDAAGAASAFGSADVGGRAPLVRRRISLADGFDGR